jgi:hypothetical protein
MSSDLNGPQRDADTTSTAGHPPTTQAVLPDLLPPDLLIILIQHLLADGWLRTLANLQQTSKTNYDLITPYLHHTRVLNTGSFTLDTILSLGRDARSIAEGVERAERADGQGRKDGSLWTEKGTITRLRVQMQFVKHIIVDRLPHEAAFEPPSPPPRPPSTTPLPSVETVTILPSVLHDLSLYFSAWVSESFLRPLAQICTPHHLILHHPDDTALGSHKHLMNLLDELRWPHLRQLTIHNVGEHALPSRPGLAVTIAFAPGVPVKWDAPALPQTRQLQKYERSRLTQLLMAIPRSVRVREGPESLGGTAWTFVGAGRFFGADHAEDSRARLRLAVKEWAEREYTGAGWTEEGVEELLRRITFVA